MAENSTDIGLIGLGVMGQSLALNIASKGFTVSIWNRTPAKLESTLKRAQAEQLSQQLKGFTQLSEFVSSIAVPRKIILLIQAGHPVDDTLQQLVPLLTAKDVVIDCGNEWFQNTTRRAAACQEKNLRYLGMGVSGGEEGARHGPSLMPGGDKSAYEGLQPILTKIAAQVDDGPCVSYIGKEGSGHYVKMVHNGIEYGDMQIIAEAYSILANLGGMKNTELHDIFRKWNQKESELSSYLIEITSDIFATQDDLDSSRHLIDMIEDVAGAKGTGKWTIQEAAERGIPCPTIEAAVSMRNISALKQDRKTASQFYPAQPRTTTAANLKGLELSDAVRDALYCSKICCYAQGFMLLQAMTKQEHWELDLGEIARTWKGGCIIRAVFLDRIKDAFRKNKDLPSLLLDENLGMTVKSRVASLRRVVETASRCGLPVPAMSASLAYFDAYRTAQLPLNLVQAQRDYFGAHTYRRIDAKGDFHTKWTK